LIFFFMLGERRDSYNFLSTKYHKYTNVFMLKKLTFYGMVVQGGCSHAQEKPIFYHFKAR
jgi:hypothetical protein